MNYKNAYDLFETAIYIRLSREDGDKEESDSVGNQRKLLTEYVAEKEELVLHDVYVDDGYSGTNFNRPGFQKMIADMESGKLNCVIVKDLSRFGRDYIDTGRYLERIFPEMGIRFISIADGIDSHKQAYDMLLPIKNIFNEQYARDISNKIHATVKSKQKSGAFIGSFACYGYRKSPANKNQLIVDAYAAEIVHRIFLMFTQGHGIQTIARILNEEGILCPSEYKAVHGENYVNPNRLESTSYWTYSTIKNILMREMYVGNMVQGKKHQKMRKKPKRVNKEDWIVVQNTHEPIITKETWDKAQSLLNKWTRDWDFQSNNHLFSGFVKCGDCSRAMSKVEWKRADGSKVYNFYCGTYKRHGKKHCSPHMIPLNVLKDIVLNDLKIILQSVHDMSDLIESQTSALSTFQEMADSEISKIKTELERMRNLKKSTYEDYKGGLLSQAEFLSYREDYGKKETLYSKQLETLEKKKRESNVKDIYEMPWLKRLITFKEVEELDRSIVIEMLDQIIVFEDKRVKIRYNFSDELENLFASVHETKVLT